MTSLTQQHPVQKQARPVLDIAPFHTPSTFFPQATSCGPTDVEQRQRICFNYH
jgi:hypothetical protein